MSADKSVAMKGKEDQEINRDDYLQAYYEKPASAKTWSGYDVKEIY